MRLVADDPPPSLIEQAASTFQAEHDKDDQIAQTVQTILLSDAFAATFGQKTKRPFELAVSFLCATGAQVQVNVDVFGLSDQMGHRLFAWPTPAGHPDVASYWTGTNAMRARPLEPAADCAVG